MYLKTYALDAVFDNYKLFILDRGAASELIR